MFITSADYKFQVEKIIQESNSIDIAVAFWGKGAEKLFANKNTPTRILCNLISGATNPTTIENLSNKKKYKSIHIKHLDDLHAKVLVGDKSAIVGSANISTNGLNIEEGEFDGWQEAGFSTHDAVELEKMRQWFEQQWKRSEEIDEDLLEKARINWAKRREERIGLPSEATSVLTMEPEALRDKKIFLALWSSYVSNEAIAVNKELHENLIDQLGAASTPPPYFFEGWDEAPYEMLPGQSIISVYVGPKGGVRVDGAYKVINDKHSTAIGTKLHICETLSKLEGTPFGKEHRRELEERIRKCARQLKPDASSVLIPLEKFLAQY